jgi:hypothetical protein
MITPGLGAPNLERIPPLLPGMLVAYRDRDHRLCGGCDDRAHGTVQVCEWIPVHREFVVVLTDGQRIRLREIRSVAQINAAGCVVAAWVTEQHGYDGKKQP